MNTQNEEKKDTFVSNTYFDIDIYGILQSLRRASSGEDLKHFFIVYSMLLQIRHRSSSYHERFASILSHQFLQYEDAEEHMYKAVMMSPDSNKYHVKYARLERRMDECVKAMNHYKYSIHPDLNPQEKEMKEGYFNVAYLYLHLQNYKDSMKYCIKSLSFDESYIFALYCEASIYFHTEQYEKAQHYFASLITKSTSSTLHIYFIAEYCIVRLKLGDYKYAKKRLKSELLKMSKNNKKTSITSPNQPAQSAQSQYNANKGKTWFAMTCYAYILSYGYYQNECKLQNENSGYSVNKKITIKTQQKLRNKIMSIFEYIMQTAMKNYYFRYYYAMSLHYYLDDLQSAQYSYQVAIKRFANLPITYMHYANLLYQMKEYKECKIILHKCNQLNLGNIQSIVNNNKQLEVKLLCLDNKIDDKTLQY